MPKERYFVDDDFNEEFIEVSRSEHHHMFHVMRSQAGEAVELVNGRGFLLKGTISSIRKSQSIVKKEEVIQESEPEKKLELFQAFARMDRLEWIVEKATELGATEITLFPGERSEKKNLLDTQMERLKNITIAALKQSGRLFLPKLNKLSPLLELKSPIEGVFGDLSEGAPYIWDFQFPNTSKRALCVGPESGFSEKEEKKLKELGLKGVRLHENVLRTETAAIFGLSLCYRSFF